MQTIQELEEFRLKFQNWMQEKNFNNRLISLLIIDPDYHDLFTFFLENRALEWLQESKIQDKKSHIDAINTYKVACMEERGLRKLRILKFRKISTKSEDIVKN